MRWVRWVVLFALGALTPATAAAKCAHPRLLVLPDVGSVLPPNPVLHVFTIGDHRRVPVVEVTEGPDREVPTRTALASRSGDLRAYRVELQIDRTADLRVKIRMQATDDAPPLDPLLFTWEHFGYRVEPAPRRVLDALKVVRSVSESFAWTCSHQDTQTLTISSLAPVYRVEWADSRTDYRAGRRTTFLVPSHMDSFFAAGAEPPPTRGEVQLGHANCLGHTIDWPLDRAGKRKALYVGIAAVLPDGSEIPAPAEPTRVEPRRHAARLDEVER